MSSITYNLCNFVGHLNSMLLQKKVHVHAMCLFTDIG